MAGVKGRSGGPRPNSGGKRPGAGRKPKPRPEPTLAEEAAIGASLPPGPDAPKPVITTDAKTFLEAVVAGTVIATPDQISAAKALLPFQHPKLGEGGKKEQRKKDAESVAGRFAPAPPRLAAVYGKKV